MMNSHIHNHRFGLVSGYLDAVAVSNDMSVLINIIGPKTFVSKSDFSASGEVSTAGIVQLRPLHSINVFLPHPTSPKTYALLTRMSSLPSVNTCNSLGRAETDASSVTSSEIADIPSPNAEREASAPTFRAVAITCRPREW
jgi:hypothetical protein